MEGLSGKAGVEAREVREAVRAAAAAALLLWPEEEVRVLEALAAAR